LREFDGYVLRLLQMTKGAKPERFAKTGVPGSNLSKLGHFLAEIAGAVEADASTFGHRATRLRSPKEKTNDN
jgi:hypothetical protein